MKAFQIDKHSKTDLSVKIKEVATPQPADNEVLVKVKTAGVNPLDNMITRGEVKLITPYAFPLTMGNEMAGVVEKVGRNVTDFKTGDRVFARLPLNKIGAFAEYVAVDKGALAHIPAYLSFAEAAAVPLTGLTAYQALEILQPKAGETIFISGGTGGFGAMAIPIAKAMGLKVITNGNLANKERVMQLGADRFLDYKTEDYTQVLSDVDYVIDTLGGKELEKQFTILKKGGKLVSLKGMPNGRFAEKMNLAWWKKIIFGLVGKKFDAMAKKNEQEYHFIFVTSNGKQLSEVAKILEQHQVKPSIDSVFPFEQASEALHKIAHKPSQGKTILSFEHL